MRGSIFFKVYQNPITTSPFYVFFPSPFLQCKDTFMDDYDGISNHNGLKYGIYGIFNIFLLINFDGDQKNNEKIM